MMGRIYYNDFDPDAAAWLREIMALGAIPEGDVDERSILDVVPSDLAGYTQCHFFAGIGGWLLALRIAGWPDDRPVWTGSPPCQPFSVAGEGKGRDDERHLAPHFLGLVRACRPPMLFGEQVASSAVFGKAASGTRKQASRTPEWAWLDDLSDRLEAARYAVGAVDFPSAGIGAPHIRQRTFFGAYDLGLAAGGMADAESTGGRSDAGSIRGSATKGLREAERSDERGTGECSGDACDFGATGRLAQPDSRERDRITEHGEHERDRAARGRVEGDGQPAGGRGAIDVADSAGCGHQSRAGDKGVCGQDAGASATAVERGAVCSTGGMADEPSSGRREEHADDGRRGLGDRAQGRAAGPDAGGAVGGLGNTLVTGLEGHARDGDDRGEPGRDGAVPARSVAETGGTGGLEHPDGRDASAEREQRGGEQRLQSVGGGAYDPAYIWPSDNRPDRAGPLNGFWRNADWLFCRDGKWRPVEARSLALADGLPDPLGRGGDPRLAQAWQAAIEEIGFPLGTGMIGRQMRLRGYGNAINPWAAAEFIGAFLDATT